MHFQRLRLLLPAAWITLLPAAAYGLNPVAWEATLSTSGEDVFWTSPSAVTPALPEYDWSYEVTELQASVLLVGEHSMLGVLGELETGAGTDLGLPISIVDELLTDEVTGSSAHIRIKVDADGFGRASATDITLGTVLGLPIQRVDFEATVSIVGVSFGDYARNGTVDLADFEIWRLGFGSTTVLEADGNRNGVVDASDYTMWRDNFGVGTATSAAAVPEAGGMLLLMIPAAVAALGRRRWGREPLPSYAGKFSSEPGSG